MSWWTPNGPPVACCASPSICPGLALRPLVEGDRFVTVEDCEKVTRQLQFALEVDGIEYRRLEVSSPGIDRPLRHAQDFERFVGMVIDITLEGADGRGRPVGR